uniref:Uncharacterized protein n=1 Tax=Takifugu rubripes TaxID=31033 RepID=A0A3B5K0Y9_TAKRU
VPPFFSQPSWRGWRWREPLVPPFFSQPSWRVQLRTLSSPADPGWPGSAGRPPSELAGRSPAPRSPQSPTPAALWSAVPPDIDSSCLSFCPQTRPRLPAAAAPGT